MTCIVHSQSRQPIWQTQRNSSINCFFASNTEAASLQSSCLACFGRQQPMVVMIRVLSKLEELALFQCFIYLYIYIKYNKRRVAPDRSEEMTSTNTPPLALFKGRRGRCKETSHLRLLWKVRTCMYDVLITCDVYAFIFFSVIKC